jgi:hypothetical protein
MCLMLYLATSNDQPLRTSPDLSVETVEVPREAVCQWFSLPTVRFIGAHTGCSCGFPSVIAEQPVEYFDGMFGDDEDREVDLSSVRSLLALIQEHVAAAGEVQLYPVWDGEEDEPPKGTIYLRLDALQPETFFFTQHFLYRITRDADRVGDLHGQ